MMDTSALSKLMALRRGRVAAEGRRLGGGGGTAPAPADDPHASKDRSDQIQSDLVGSQETSRGPRGLAGLLGGGVWGGVGPYSAPVSRRTSLGGVEEGEGEGDDLGEEKKSSLTLSGGDGTGTGDGDGEVEVATIQVKREDGQVLIFQMGVTRTVGDLRRRVQRSRGGGGGEQGDVDFEIRSAFPARSYTNMEETLEEAGLTPSATLFIKPKKS